MDETAALQWREAALELAAAGNAASHGHRQRYTAQMPLPFDHARAFTRGAADYARHRPDYPESLFDWIATEAPARTLAVDVATGGGQGVRGLLPHFERVIATDHGAELLATLPADPRLRTLVQPAEALDVGESADVVTVFQALHWFAEPAFFERVRRALRPGGLFVIVGYAWFNVTPAIDAVVAQTLLAPLEPLWSPKNRLLLEGYRGVVVPFAELTPPAFGIELDWTRDDLLAYAATWSAVTRLREAGGTDVIEATTTALAPVWVADERRRVTMPLSVRAFRRGSDPY